MFYIMWQLQNTLTKYWTILKTKCEINTERRRCRISALKSVTKYTYISKTMIYINTYKLYQSCLIINHALTLCYRKTSLQNVSKPVTLKTNTEHRWHNTNTERRWYRTQMVQDNYRTQNWTICIVIYNVNILRLFRATCFFNLSSKR